MRIAFVWDWPPDYHQAMTWKDGLAAAIQILSQRHEVSFFTMGNKTEVWKHPFFDIQVCCESDVLKTMVAGFMPDVILHWADCTRPNARPLAELGYPMALCFAGGDPMGPTMQYFDHFFVESEVYREQFEVAGVSVSTAFGTNTDVFKPIPWMRKHFATIFPATYCEWKRHYLFTEATKGWRNLTCGFMYGEHERDCWEETMKAGVMTLPHVSAEVLAMLYASSEVCLVTSKASGGSQRTVLEAMACGVPVVVTSDGKGAEYVEDAQKLGFFVGKTCEPEATALREAVESTVKSTLDSGCQLSQGVEYIASKWTHNHYADALERGMLGLINQ